MTATNGAETETAGEEVVVAPDVGLPTRLNVRRAFEVYVLGRDRTLAPDEKDRAVPAGAPTPVTGRDGGEAPVVAAAAVSVPHELSFDRGAGTWRLRRSPSKEGAPSA
ncbi:MAG: hypothetical protein Q8W45_09900 [Candidatus Palauibacterales bacterium]|nr:hypothetical protein [Candidatus Palauibacterales bacterium]MDP2483585.1 hypothetical protein [Candidatus Palauibacterales bacterium]